jgi:serine/threonine-protein kinase RIM15
VLRKLGQGSFANVYLARFLDTRQVYALKALRKDEVLRRGLHDQVTKERTALTMASRYTDASTGISYRIPPFSTCRLRNLPPVFVGSFHRYPNYFVKLMYCFQNDEHLFFVMEYMEGGDCLSLISSMKRLPEHVAQHFMAQVCVALQHLHQHGVIHRDIKPDNVMVSTLLFNSNTTGPA